MFARLFRELMHHSPTIALAEGHGKKTARPLHEDGARDAVSDGWDTHMPLHGLRLEQGAVPKFSETYGGKWVALNELRLHTFRM